MRSALAVALLAASCSSGSHADSDAQIDVASIDAAADAACPAPLLAASHGEAFSYGRHYPNGAAAVAYAYGAEGTWKHMNPLVYDLNYYMACASTAHPYDRNGLIAYADGTHFATAADANCHLLCDADHDGALDAADCGFAFHEHDGKGAGGATKGTPFTVFWFDDNWLARYMSQAYDMPLPSGLSDYSDFTRWRILGGDRTNWTPYGSAYYDTLALDGLYALAGGDTSGALAKWNAMLTNSNATYDSATQRFVYPSITENYHLGLFKLLTDQLLGEPSYGASTQLLLLQHSEALRSNILDNQEVDASGPLGWRSDRTQTNSLINTESIAVSVLGLASREAAVFEPGVAPLSFDANSYFVRPYHALSAVVSLSTAGTMVRGPGTTAAPGTYDVMFALRAPQPTGTTAIATVAIVDTTTNTTLASRDVMPADFAPSNQWTAIHLSATLPDACDTFDTRVVWTGTTNLDVGSIRVH